MMAADDPGARAEPIPPTSCDGVGQEEMAYVWGALEADARAPIDSHRAECRACDARLAAAERVIAHVDQALPRVAPPPELRARLLREIGRLEQPSAPTAASATPVPVPAPPRRGAAPPPAHPATARPSLDGTRPRLERRTAGSSRWVRRPHRVPRFFAGVATGLAGAACALALAWLLIVRSDLSGLLLPNQSELTGTDPASNFPVNLSDVARPAAHTLLDLRPPAGSARGVLMVDPDGTGGVLLVHDPGAPPGARYEVWLTRGADRVQVGALTLDTRGIGSYLLPDPLPLPHPQRIEVDPTGGGSPLSADF